MKTTCQNAKQQQKPKSLQLKSLFQHFCCGKYNKNGPKKPKRYRNKPKKNDIVVENTTMAKISCSGANGGNDVKSTTFLYKNTLKNHSFYANMRAVEMTKIKT